MSLLVARAPAARPPDAAALRVRPAVPGHAAAAAGAHPEGRGALPAPRRALGRRAASPAGRRRRCACSPRPTRRRPRCSCCRTAATTSWSPTPAAATAAGRTSPSRAGARTPPATTGARSATSATWRAASSGRPRTSRRCERADALRGDLLRGARRVPPPRQRLRDAHRDRRLAGGRHRAAPGPHHQPLAHAPHDRGHELRRGRARAARRRRAAPGVPQPVRADRDRPRSGRRSCARAGRARADEQPPWMFHLMAAARRANRSDVSYETDRMAFIGRGRTVAGAARDDATARAVRQPGLGARSDRRDPPPDHARAGADGDDRHRHRHRRDPRRRARAWSGSTRTGTSPTASSTSRGRTAR